MQIVYLYIFEQKYISFIVLLKTINLYLWTRSGKVHKHYNYYTSPLLKQ